MRKLLKTLTLWLWSGLFLAIILSVVSEFFIKWAEQNGLYDNPNERVMSALSVLQEVVQSGWFWGLTGILTGLTAGLRVDRFLRPKEEGVAHEPLNDRPYVQDQINEEAIEDTYMGAHNDLMLFCVDHLIPACSALFRVQELIIYEASAIELLGVFAARGARPAPISQGYEILSVLCDSPPEYVRLDRMKNAVALIEGNYKDLVEQIRATIYLTKRGLGSI